MRAEKGGLYRHTGLLADFVAFGSGFVRAFHGRIFCSSLVCTTRVASIARKSELAGPCSQDAESWNFSLQLTVALSPELWLTII